LGQQWASLKGLGNTPLTRRSLLGNRHTMEHGVLAPTGLNDPIHAFLIDQTDLLEDLRHALLRPTPLHITLRLLLMAVYHLAICDSPAGTRLADVRRKPVGRIAPLRRWQRGDMEDMVNDGFASRGGDVFLGKLHAARVDVKGDDLAGGVGVRDRCGDETDRTTAAAGVSVSEAQRIWATTNPTENNMDEVNDASGENIMNQRRTDQAGGAEVVCKRRASPS
jgi:hypothetical protein